jgi:hypothetical protein
MTNDLGDWASFYAETPAIAATLLVIAIGTRAFIPQGLPSERVLKLEQILTVIELSVALAATLAMLVPSKIIQATMVSAISLIALAFTVTHSVAFILSWKKHKRGTYSRLSKIQALGNVVPAACYVYLILIHTGRVPWCLDWIAVPILWLLFSGTFQTIFYVQRHLSMVPPATTPQVVEVKLLQPEKAPFFWRKRRGS